MNKAQRQNNPVVIKTSIKTKLSPPTFYDETEFERNNTNKQYLYYQKENDDIESGTVSYDTLPKVKPPISFISAATIILHRSIFLFLLSLIFNSSYLKNS